MLDLPRNTHRYFLEPLSRTRHITKSLKQRFINFIGRLGKSKKEVLRSVLRLVESDCRSTTGVNIRKLLIEEDVHQISLINIDRRPYKVAPHGEDWKIILEEEILDIKSGQSNVENFSMREVDEISHYVCTM